MLNNTRNWMLISYFAVIICDFACNTSKRNTLLIWLAILHCIQRNSQYLLPICFQDDPLVDILELKRTCQLYTRICQEKPAFSRVISEFFMPKGYLSGQFVNSETYYMCFTVQRSEFSAFPPKNKSSSSRSCRRWPLETVMSRLSTNFCLLKATLEWEREILSA